MNWNRGFLKEMSAVLKNTFPRQASLWALSLSLSFFNKHAYFWLSSEMKYFKSPFMLNMSKITSSKLHIEGPQNSEIKRRTKLVKCSSVSWRHTQTFPLINFFSVLGKIKMYCLESMIVLSGLGKCFKTCFNFFLILKF